MSPEGRRATVPVPVMPVGVPHSPMAQGPEVLWEASPAFKKNSQMEKFRQHVIRKYGMALESYEDLYNWSTRNISQFWAEVWEFCQVLHSRDYDQTLDESVLMDEIPEWFPGSRLNFAENLLRFRDDSTALIFAGEGFQGETRMSYAELYREVAKATAALKGLGISTGDVVAVSMLAAAAIGAIFTTISPDFGVSAVQDRLSQTKPKLLISCNAVFYNGKVHDHFAKLRAVVADVPSLQSIVILRWIGEHQEILGLKHLDYDQLLDQYTNVETVDFAQLPFNHPLYILYSSGTTGKPKCLVHSAGGTLIQHLKEHKLHGDIRRDDVFIQYTTIGWMMWHWMVSALATGCTIVLYDGSPFKPDALSMWRLTERLGISAFGTSAKYIQHLQELSQAPREHCDLSRLRVMFSTGSPLSPDNFRFVYQNIKSDLMMSSITGGTDIISLFGAGNPLLPVYCGEIQCRGLGMAVDSFDERGDPVRNGPGDLVCTRPFPCMPVFFWNDPDGRLYRAAYFHRFPHIWHHGDFLQINKESGGMLMLGRSDGTLNPAGVRFGSAELYNIVCKYPEIADSLAVGFKLPGEDDERVALFLQLRDSYAELSASLVDRLRVHIRNALSPRHVPCYILRTPAIPYTINGKKVEVAVKRILSGAIDVPVMSVGNPESLQFYRDLARDGLKP